MTPKELTGTDLGTPSLTPRAWYEVSLGRRAWEYVDNSSPEVWWKYLDWYRHVIELPVENEAEIITSIESAGDLLLAHLRRVGRIESVHARKNALATGVESNGGWRAPRTLIAGRYADLSDDIDFGRLAGKRDGLLDVDPSALDNAIAALEAGAARVDLCFCHADNSRVNPLIWMNFTFMLDHFGELTGPQRWRFMGCYLERPPSPAHQDAFLHFRRVQNLAWDANCGWRSVSDEGDFEVVYADIIFTLEFIVFATSFETDLSARPMLASIVDRAALKDFQGDATCNTRTTNLPAFSECTSGGACCRTLSRPKVVPPDQ